MKILIGAFLCVVAFWLLVLLAVGIAIVVQAHPIAGTAIWVSCIWAAIGGTAGWGFARYK